MTDSSFDHVPDIPGSALVLGMTADLAAHLDTLTVDEIDGEFYWRCCRAELAAPIAAFRAEQILPGHDATGDSRSPFAYLAAAYRFVDAVRRLEDTLLGGYPRVILDQLVVGNRVPMRIPEVAVHAEVGKGVTYRMAVYSGSWTGEDVERAFMAATGRLLLPVEELVTRARPNHDPGDAHAEIQAATPITFRLVTDPAQARVSDRGPVRVPFIEVVAHNVMPEPGDLAYAYDRKARRREQLHLRLPGATTRQEKEVALRTWATGLLTAGGMKNMTAIAEVASTLDAPEVTQACFIQDRQNLISRVPEAEPYLYVRR